MEFSVAECDVTGWNLLLSDLSHRIEFGVTDVMSQDRIYCYRIGYLGIQFNLTEFVVLGCDLVL